jgi:hypothetical protein
MSFGDTLKQEKVMFCLWLAMGTKKKKKKKCGLMMRARSVATRYKTSGIACWRG